VERTELSIPGRLHFAPQSLHRRARIHDGDRQWGRAGHLGRAAPGKRLITASTTSLASAMPDSVSANVGR